MGKSNSCKSRNCTKLLNVSLQRSKRGEGACKSELVFVSSAQHQAQKCLPETNALCASIYSCCVRLFPVNRLNVSKVYVCVCVCVRMRVCVFICVRVIFIFVLFFHPFTLHNRIYIHTLSPPLPPLSPLHSLCLVVLLILLFVNCRPFATECCLLVGWLLNAPATSLNAEKLEIPSTVKW